MGIISSLKKKKETVFAFSNLVNDFIPYACHINNETILTKNGELLQTIKIVGISQDKLGTDIDDLRGIIRKAIIDNVNTTDYALWIHTVRRKANLDPSKHYDSVFAHDLHESWCAKNFWREKFINELYITVLHRGKLFDINNTSDLLNSFSYIYQRKNHSLFLDQCLERLYSVTNAILTTLSVYGAVRLKMVEHERTFKCEIVEFFSKIIHLHQGNVSAPIKDISECLASGKVAFGNNTFQVLHQHSKHFGAMFSIKEYHDFSSNLINQLLKTPQEYVVTQALSFISNKEALKQLKNTDYITSLSKDDEFREKSGLKKMLDHAKNSPTDFCKQQMTLMIFGEDQAVLNQAIARMYESISKLGIAIVREDLLAETLYWAQLPGNFRFIKRTSVMSTNNIGGYASLHNAPSGNSSSIWGPPITIFRRKDSTPYFFNFHVGNLGHSLIIGNKDSAKNTLMNFLVAESTKISPKIFAICGNKSSQITIKALGGKYCNVGPNSHYFNPLQMDDNESNRFFLHHWFSLLLETEDDEQINGIIDQVYRIDKKQRNLNNFSSMSANPIFLEKIKPWQSAGKYSTFFCNENDFFDIQTNNIVGFDFSESFTEGPNFYLPTIMYIIYRFNLLLDETPSIFMINNCDQLFAETQFITQLADLLDYFTSKNCVGIITANAEEFDKYALDDEIIAKIANKIFMPDKEFCDQYATKLKLSEDTINKIKDMKLLYRHFMILQNDESTICEINLDGIDYAIAALSGNNNAIAAMNQAIANSSDKPTDWLHAFYQKIV